MTDPAWCCWCGCRSVPVGVPVLCPGCGRELNRILGAATTLGELADLVSDGWSVEIGIDRGHDGLVTCVLARLREGERPALTAARWETGATKEVRDGS